MGTVTDYIASRDEPVRGVLTRIHERARELVPDATEGTGYGMPALLHRGRPLLAVTQTKSHLSLFPFSGSLVSEVEADLVGFSLSKGTIRFSPEQPIPSAVLDRIIVMRRDEIDAKEG
ncbi:DUF1801 domain-containing protein [Microbacterium sp.]|uniref:iron chaperone n=1 Tax=Microbacterium sp. TaxID=51671 RepID=UPI0028125C6B|nr:DUF1801 domain-containing protein [Microbacterium sp.]